MEKRYGVPVLEAYAMSEAAHQMTSNPLPPAQRKSGSVGVGQGVEIAVLDASGNRLIRPREIGEICARGANITSGYINRPEANQECFTKDGWFRTGDQGFTDEDGYVFLTGRLKELINRGGEKISPLEIDAVLLEHPSVDEAVSFGMPDPIYGEQVHAAVVLKPPFHGSSGAVQEAELLSFCQKRLASFKCPQQIHIAKQLPRTATGKIQRRIVADHFQKSAAKAKL
jgi:acyl-CoA synthetase (AMP-forming)/AMP-acid ligase II